MVRIYVAGHRGPAGGALIRRLTIMGEVEVVTAERDELDLRDGPAAHNFLASRKPYVVYIAAAVVGGIEANRTRPADFILDNLMILTNIIHAAHDLDISRLLFLGSSCAYPRMAEQPIREAALLAGALEPTNEPYAIAKIAGVKLVESLHHQYGHDYRAVVPANLYGPGDRFSLNGSHVLPALMRHFHNAVDDCAAEVTVWGTGRPRRGFLHVDDFADACIYLVSLPHDTYRQDRSSGGPRVNIGTGVDITIAELARMLAYVTGYREAIRFDPNMPDGTPRKVLGVSVMKQFGWTAQTE